MADQQPTQSSLASTFPNPPHFWHDFTPDRVSRLESLRKTRAGQPGSAVETTTDWRIPDLPEDLTNLQPPPEPALGQWRCFGDLYTIKDELPALEEQGIERLVPQAPEPSSTDKHTDRAFELKRLAKSILLNFLELLGVLGTNPGQAEEKVTDIRNLFINFHHVVNEYRPHQARESLIALMQTQLDKTRAETAAVRAATDKAKRVLEGLGSIEVPDQATLIGDANGERPGSAEEQKEAAYWENERDLWATIDAEFA